MRYEWRILVHQGRLLLIVLLFLPLENAQADSARGNLASTFVNAFVNAGYTTDKLVTPADSQWLFRNKGNGVMSVAASLGMILQVQCAPSYSLSMGCHTDVHACA